MRVDCHSRRSDGQVTLASDLHDSRNAAGRTNKKRGPKPPLGLVGSVKEPEAKRHLDTKHKDSKGHGKDLISSFFFHFLSPFNLCGVCHHQTLGDTLG